MEPQQARSIETRRRVLVAARALVEEVGIDGLTLALVAGRAGVAVGTVYTRFEDRSHLIEEVVRAWTTEVTVAFDAARDAGGVVDPGSGVVGLVRLFRENRAFIRQLLIHGPLHPGIAQLIDPWVSRERERLVCDLDPHRADPHRADLLATMALSTVERAAINDADEATWMRLQADLPVLLAELLARGGRENG